jgi:hypothetical protein
LSPRAISVEPFIETLRMLPPLPTPKDNAAMLDKVLVHQRTADA